MKHSWKNWNVLIAWDVYGKNVVKFAVDWEACGKNVGTFVCKWNDRETNVGTLVDGNNPKTIVEDDNLALFSGHIPIV